MASLDARLTHVEHCAEQLQVRFEAEEIGRALGMTADRVFMEAEAELAEFGGDLDAYAKAVADEAGISVEQLWDHVAAPPPRPFGQN